MINKWCVHSGDDYAHDDLRNRKEASAAGVEEDGEGDVSEHFKKVMGVGYETSKEACSRSNKSLLNFF